MVLALNSEIILPENAPVRPTNAQLEEPDYRQRYEAHSSKGLRQRTEIVIAQKKDVPRNFSFRDTPLLFAGIGLFA
ncbi:MAG: hypothetical protein J6M06_02745 [Synergistaceae bacterium]|nr:hypothetical protein [Synergistaceae bacterium]